MHKALAARKKQRQAGIHLAKQYTRRLKSILGSLCAVLCGSFARGDFNLGSDVDVLIISDSLPPHPLARMKFLYRYVEGEIEPKGYRREEFSRMLSSNNPIAVDAFKNGIVLIDDGFWMRLKRDYSNKRG